MQSRMRTLRKILFFRLFALSAILSVLVGGGVFMQQKLRFEAVVAERTHLAVELLRLRIYEITSISQRPWQSLVQQALDDLERVSAGSVIGHFVWLSVRDAGGAEVGRLGAADSPAQQELVRAAEGLTVVSGNQVALKPLLGPDGLPAYAIGMNFVDEAGRVQATLRGVYEIAAETAEVFRQDIFRSIAVLVLVVGLVTVLHYPVIRRMIDRLGRLSINLLDTNLETLQGLGSAIAKRDSDTDGHNLRVTIYAVYLAEAAGLRAGEIRTLIKGAFLHDVGKIGIRDDILLKPGRLDAAEFEIMKTHVRHGLEIIRHCHWLQDAGEVVGNHHEKYDGSGYYQGLRQQEIPLTARIFAIVDVFDALTSERPYKRPMGLEEALGILQRDAGNHFDPELLRLFLGLAEPLYLQFAGHEAAAREELADIIHHYFKRDIADLCD